MHTHHSHSGQFCQHAKDTLEEIVDCAERSRLRLLCLTEHAPRVLAEHLYPEEVASGTRVEDLRETFAAYYLKARELQAARSRADFKIMVGFEAEGLDAGTLAAMQELCREYAFDMVVGSVHHVHGIPIDYDREQFEAARGAAGGLEELFAAYFEQQHAMILALRPTVVAHFDLVRLFSPDHTISPANWKLVERNVEVAIGLGCLFEINTAALRKGWATPYPQPDICELIKARGGKFCLSDDSHGVAQVALFYSRVGEYISAYGPLYGADGSVVSAQEYREWATPPVDLRLQEVGRKYVHRETTGYKSFGEVMGDLMPIFAQIPQTAAASEYWLRVAGDLDGYLGEWHRELSGEEAESVVVGVRLLEKRVMEKDILTGTQWVRLVSTAARSRARFAAITRAEEWSDIWCVVSERACERARERPRACDRPRACSP